MINRTFEGPEDMSAGYLTNADFIRTILYPEVIHYNQKSKKDVRLVAPKRRKSISLDFFLDEEADDDFAIPLKIKNLKALKQKLSKTVLLNNKYYTEFDEDVSKNLEAARQYFVLSGLKPLLFMRTEFGSDDRGFVIRDSRKKYESKLEHWVDHHKSDKGRPWTAHIKLQGLKQGRLIDNLYLQITGYYLTFAIEK